MKQKLSFVPPSSRAVEVRWTLQPFAYSKNNVYIENRLEDMGRGKGKLGRSERVALTYIHYQL